MLNSLLFTILALLGYGLYRICGFVLRPYLSPWRNFPRPPSKSFIRGNQKEVFGEPAGDAIDRWVAQYGETFVWKTFLNEDRLVTLDAKANAHFLNRTDIYRKPGYIQRFFLSVVGNGLATAEGEAHKKQRRVMGPAFGATQVGQFSGVFLAKANELRDKLTEIISSDESTSPTAKSSNHAVNLLPWLGKATLDVIGLAGFLYSFDSLNSSKGTTNELREAFALISRRGETISLWTILTTFMPILRIIPVKQERDFAHAKSVMQRVGTQLIAERKAHILASIESGNIDKAAIQDRDLLSLLLRANMAQDLPDSQRMTDEEVLSQMPTFLAAGHDTTSTTLQWVLYALSQNPNVQSRLRSELRTVVVPNTYSTEPLDKATLNALNSLPYLDAVIRETLRLYSPVSGISRTAVCDDVIHLEKPFVDLHGVLRDTIRIPKGHTVMIPFSALHRSPTIWGPDALVFRPDRWLGSGPGPLAAAIPGVFSNLLAFSGGPRSCIGWRFSLLETKVFLHVLVTSLHFAPTGQIILQKAGVIMRPQVLTEEEKGYQLPLLVSKAGDQ